MSQESGRVRVTTGKIKGKSKLIALRLTPEEKVELDAKLRASGFSSFQAAFEAFLTTSSVSAAMTKIERDYKVKKQRAFAVRRSLGRKNVRVMGNVFRNYARSLGVEVPVDTAEAARNIPENWEMIVAKMMKNWPGDIGVLLDFKEYLGLLKDLNELGAEIRAGTGKIVGGITPEEGVSVSVSDESLLADEPEVALEKAPNNALQEEENSPAVGPLC